MTRLVLGAYAAAPADLSADAAAEANWYARLRDEPLVGGLELAWDGGLHPDGVQRTGALLDPSWSSVVTMMSGTSTRLLVDPHYGLASDREASRLAAVADVARAHDEIMAVRSLLGPAAVRAIEIQSSPSALTATASERAFVSSLSQVLALDWEDVVVVVEHCDAKDGADPQKGFLPLSAERTCLDEARARASTQLRTGHAINWARSAIEGRAAETPESAINSLSGSGRLAGLMFSGVSPIATVFGGAWADAHLPVADGGPGSEPLSLLTAARVRRALLLAGPIPYLGAKVSAPKSPGLRHEERLAPGLATLRTISEAAA
jgi:hypothetical protein